MKTKKTSFLTRNNQDSSAKLAKSFQKRTIQPQAEQFFKINENERVFTLNKFCLWLEPKHEFVLKNISIAFRQKCTTAIIGKSGSGKSTLIRSLNRINEEMNSNMRTSGNILHHNFSIYDRKTRVHLLRKRVGMVFQKPLPFDMSIYNNVRYPLKINGIRNKQEQQKIIIKALQDVGLFEEVRDRLSQNALDLSGGQQQRLCIARAICLNPEVLLLDEPTSALDPIATIKIEKLITELSQKYTIIFVTHSIKQAIRISKYTIYMDHGEIIEYNETLKLFNRPKNPKTIRFIENEE